MVDLRFERPGRTGAPAANSGVVMRKMAGCNSACRGDGDRRAPFGDCDSSVREAVECEKGGCSWGSGLQLRGFDGEILERKEEAR